MNWILFLGAVTGGAFFGALGVVLITAAKDSDARIDFQQRRRLP